jgi:hypothetical protein
MTELVERVNSRAVVHRVVAIRLFINQFLENRVWANGNGFVNQKCLDVGQDSDYDFNVNI